MTVEIGSKYERTRAALREGIAEGSITAVVKEADGEGLCLFFLQEPYRW